MATACIAHSALRVHGISKPIIARFDQPQASSDGGAILLKAVDDRLGLTWRLACAIRDRRQPGKVAHPLRDLLRQRVFGLACGYADTWCYLPLLATVTFNTEPIQHVVAALLRPGTGAATRGVRGLLRRLFTKLRTVFPRARLRVRADAGFTDAKLLAFLDAAEVEYVLGLAGNRRLDKRVRRLLGRARMQARTTGETATRYGETRYAARRWNRKRRIIMKAEVLCYPGRLRKDNPRFLVTNLPHRPATVYTRLYCGRGDMENRLKELQQGLAMDRTSCSRFAANQLRLVFSVAAYVLFQALQSFARVTVLGSAQVWTLRERLLKVAVWVERSVRRIVLHLPQAFPWRDTWRELAQALTAP